MVAGCDLAVMTLGAAKASAESQVITPAGTTDVHHAACAQDLKKVRALVEDGWAIDAKNKNDETPLTYAIRCGAPDRPTDADLVRFLIRSGADPNARDHLNGGTVLHTAATRGVVTGDVSLVNLLVTNGAKVDVVTQPGGPTALYRAVDSQRLDAVRDLVKAGADPNKQRYVGKALTASGVCDKDFEVSIWGKQRVDFNEREFSTRIRILEILMEAGAQLSASDLIAGDRHCKSPDWDRGRNRLVEYVRQNHSAKIVGATLSNNEEAR
jgi:hypothetical protein